MHTKNEIANMANFINRMGYTPLSGTTKHKFWSKKNIYSSVFEKAFFDDLKCFIESNKDDLQNLLKIKIDLHRLVVFTHRNIRNTQYCEYDSVNGYIKLIKMYKSKWYMWE